ncbi:MAG: TlpA disulfide reductase family protein [Thermoplasmata archaeon]|jgi:peroxiredoxin
MARRRKKKDARKEARKREERGATKAKRTKHFAYLGVIVLVVAALVLVIVFSPRGGPGFNVGQQARDFEVTDTDGNVFRLSAQRGNVLVVDWMGTNCPPCRIQMPELVKLHEAFRARGLVMISIDMNDFGSGLAAENEGQARAFLAEFGATWPIALERTGLATRYSVIGIPTIMIVDPSGLIVFKVAGVHTFADLSAIVEPLLPA